MELDSKPKADWNDGSPSIGSVGCQYREEEASSLGEIWERGTVNKTRQKRFKWQGGGGSD